MNNIVSLDENQIIETISKVCGHSTIEVLYKKTRKKEITECRQLIYYFIRKYVASKTRYNEPIELQNISKIFKKNHATILIAIRKVNDLIKYNKEFRAKFEAYDTMLKRLMAENFCPFCGKEMNHEDQVELNVVNSI